MTDTTTVAVVAMGVERGDIIQIDGSDVRMAVLDVGHFTIKLRRATWLDLLRAWARGVWWRLVSAVRS